jgi:Lipocalin-like domain
MSGSTNPSPVARASATSGAITSQLVGVWTLVSFVSLQDGLEESFPFGPKPEGFLIYTSDGYVSAQLMKPGRSLFQSRDWQQATASEFQDAGSGYIGYCGVYAVDEEKETVTHFPSVALVPNLINGKQLRLVHLRGDRLTLRTTGSFVENGKSITSRLEWQRVPSKGSTASTTFDSKKEKERL